MQSKGCFCRVLSTHGRDPKEVLPNPAGHMGGADMGANMVLLMPHTREDKGETVGGGPLPHSGG